jgi:hypothetical protein
VRSRVIFDLFSKVPREPDRSNQPSRLDTLIGIPLVGFSQRIRSGFTTFRHNYNQLEDTLANIEDATEIHFENLINKLQAEFAEMEREREMERETRETPNLTRPVEPYFTLE